MCQISLIVNLYDYLEIACMFKYEVGIRLKSEKYCEGLSLTIFVENGREFLMLEEDKSTSSIVKFELNDVSSMTVLTEGARFNKIEFK